MDSSDFSRLPPEMLAYIFRKLHLDSQKLSRLVCKRWLLIIDEHCIPFHNATLSNDTLDCVKSLKSRLLRSRIRTLHVKDFDRDMSQYPATFSRSPLVLNPERLRITVSRYTPIYDPDSDPLTTGKNIADILRLNPSVEFLRLKLATVEPLRRQSLSGLRFSQLRVLKVSLTGYMSLNEKIFNRISAPSLHKISLEAVVPSRENFFRDQTMLVLFKLLAGFRSSIREVSMKHKLAASSMPILLHPILPLPKQHEIDKMESELSEITLDILSFKFFPRRGFQDYALGIPLLTRQSELKTLKIEIYPDDQAREMKLAAATAITKSLDSLRNLSISCTGYGGLCWLLANYIDDIWYILQRSQKLEFLDFTSFWIPTVIHPFPITLRELCLGLIRPTVMLSLSSTLKALELFQFSGFAFEAADDYDAAKLSILEFLKIPSLKTIKWRLDGELVNNFSNSETIRISSSWGETKYTKRFQYTTIQILNH